MPKLKEKHPLHPDIVWMKCKKCGKKYELLKGDLECFLDQPHYCPDCYFKLNPGKNRSLWDE